MKHEGKHRHRLGSNPLEKKFHDAWIRMNEGCGVTTLDHLLGDGRIPNIATDQQAELAATVIQWLGSPVGQNFVKDVMGLK